MKSAGRGLLFYNVAKVDAGAKVDATKPCRPRSVKTRERLASWVRELGVTDPALSPTHAWRHLFKQIGRRCGMNNVMLDCICGHAAKSDGDSYGEPTLTDKAVELAKFPRYRVDG